ncbi:uncharacterized protein LOC106011343 [Aplysia californica]|uniref:Uncharacterized protein LOC106011343 n=1 Tax=Aplysia californica TaxID=6500 RepID=A0ABM0ZWN2_APLCA|nr:uncharacterized protein LOC106011343 [Aplysia californica]
MFILALDMRLILLLLYVTSFASFSAAMLDVNHSELRYVADHLTAQKCSLLLKALKQKQFQLQEQNPAIEFEPKPCMTRLTRWAEHEGRNMTFDFLALRLREIGMKRLSSRLSKRVLHKTSEELHRYFLDDPFREMLPTKSVMIPVATSAQLMPAPDEEDTHDHLFAVVVVMATICLTLFASACACILCPRASHFLCLRACPSVCSASCQVLTEGCQRAWHGTVSGAGRYMLVVPRGAENEGLLV